MTFNWRPFFPFGEPRQQQTEAIEFILDSFLTKNKRFVCADLATGVGKSAVAICISRFLESLEQVPLEMTSKGTYIITTQKTLQEQYLNDFGYLKGQLKSIKSSSNYDCKRQKGKTCGEVLTLLRKNKDNFSPCMGDCVYKKERADYLSSKEGITNFPYFLMDANYSGKLKPRELLIIDEAHNVESCLSSFIEISISEKFAKQILKLSFPADLKTEYQSVCWIRDVYLEKLNKHIEYIDSIFEKHSGLKSKLNEISNFAKQYDLYVSHQQKIRKFLKLYSKDNWAFKIIDAKEKSSRKIEFKPVDISKYAEDNLFRFGEKILLMSATLLNKEAFCSSVGIEQQDCEFISMASPFPKENRPIFIVQCGKMGRDYINETLPKLVEKIKSLLEMHKEEKGIIHSHSYLIANYIKQNIRSSRLLIHDSLNREQILNEHIDSKEPTVLLSPSMSEGVDLYGERSRFQIMCKVPYPNLGDTVIRKRMNKDKLFYPYNTCKTIIQSLGRSIRSESDYAITYLLDSDFSYFFERNKNMFPPHFFELIQEF